MVDQRGRDGVAHTPSRREPPAPIDIRSSPETSTNGRHYIGMPTTVVKVSREHSMAAASSLIRWGGTAAMLGGLSTTFVTGLLPPLSSSNEGE
jgi:hypothetical protein